MTWAFKILDDAEKDLGELPKAIQKRVARALARWR